MTKAKKVLADLTSAGFGREATSLIALGKGNTAQGTGALGIGGLRSVQAPGLGMIHAMGPLSDRLDAPDGLTMSLTRLGVPEHDARLYLRHIQMGHTLIELRTRDDRAAEAAQIMSRGGALPIEETAQTTGMAQAEAAATPPQARPDISRTTPAAPPPAKPDIPARAAQGPDQIREQVVQEEIHVGKREVERGGVRVFTHISEQPVQEQVTLHEEHVDVERRPVNRPATEADLKTSKQGEEVVMRERGEEAVVAKEARVVEEVVVHKEAQDRTETIRDTVRRKDVDVEQIPGRTAGTGPIAGQAGLGDFARYEDDFRGHSRAFAGRGQGYEQLTPAYKYGMQLAGDQRYRGQGWESIRDRARTDWEQRSPGTFDRVEGAVRYAYEKVRGR